MNYENMFIYFTVYTIHLFHWPGHLVECVHHIISIPTLIIIRRRGANSKNTNNKIEPISIFRWNIIIGCSSAWCIIITYFRKKVHTELYRLFYNIISNTCILICRALFCSLQMEITTICNRMHSRCQCLHKYYFLFKTYRILYNTTIFSCHGT